MLNSFCADARNNRIGYFFCQAIVSVTATGNVEDVHRMPELILRGSRKMLLATRAAADSTVVLPAVLLPCH